METNGRTLTGSNLEVFPGQPRARPVREGWRGSAMTVRWASERQAGGRAGGWRQDACEKVS